jgi:glutathione S-transferase
MAIVHGASASPFVRKVRVFLAEKGVPYELNPVTPFPPLKPEFKQISPLGKIPVYQDGAFSVPDSSVICAYLERKHPSPPLYPQQHEDYARALWFEEWADGGLVTVAGPKIFFPRVIGVLLMKKPADEEAVTKAIREDLPPYLDYLEGELGDGDWLVGGRFSIADIGVGSQFVNLKHAGVTADAARWPKLAAYVDRVHSRPSFKALIEEESKLFSSLK